MSEADAPQTAEAPGGARSVVVVKKYANRRLYDTESSSYITLDNLAEMIRAGRDFVVYDARSGEDITRSVLTQIIVEEESKGSALLPTAFLRQLIGLYGGSMQGLVPRYLEQTMAAFARQQEQMRDAMSSTLGTLLPPGLDEMRRQNMAIMERAMTLFSPFYRPAGNEDAAPAGCEPDHNLEIETLRREVERLRGELHAATEAAQAKKVVASATDSGEEE